MKTKPPYCFTIFVLMVMAMQSAYAQSVGINATGAAPHASAMLDVAGNNSGILIPRVNLATAVFPAPGPATHLMVINTNASYGQGVGAYRNAGTPTAPNWVKWLEYGDAWGIQGNSGTNSATDFIGTTDNTNFVIRTGAGGTMASRRRITIPYAISGGDIIIENVRAVQLVPFTGANTFGSPMLRFGTNPGTGLSATDLTGNNIAITYGAGGVSGYLFHTTGLTIDYNRNGYPAPPQSGTRLDVIGSIYTRDQIVYSRGHNSQSPLEATGQDRTAEVKRYWSTAFSGNGESLSFYSENNASELRIQFRMTRVGANYFLEMRKYGTGNKSYVSSNLTGATVTLPGAASAWGAWTQVTNAMTAGTGTRHEILISSEQATAGNNLEAFYKFTVFFNGNNGATDYIRVLTEAYYNH